MEWTNSRTEHTRKDWAGLVFQFLHKFTSILAYSAKKLLVKHPELKFEKLAEIWPELFAEFMDDRFLEERIRNEERYAPLARQLRLRQEQLQMEMDLELPTDLDYQKMDGLKLEIRERLHEHKPPSLAAAAK